MNINTTSYSLTIQDYNEHDKYDRNYENDGNDEVHSISDCLNDQTYGMRQRYNGEESKYDKLKKYREEEEDYLEKISRITKDYFIIFKMFNNLSFCDKMIIISLTLMYAYSVKLFLTSQPSKFIHGH
jgi:hypothetical protein